MTPRSRTPCSPRRFVTSLSTCANGTRPASSHLICRALADNVLWEVYRDQPGGSQYYNEKPIEADANAASGAFLRSRFPEDIQAAVFEHDDGRGYGHHAEDSPGDPKTLVVRTLEFIKSYPEEARQRASIGIPFGRFLELMHGPEAAAIWAELQA